MNPTGPIRSLFERNALFETDETGFMLDCCSVPIFERSIMYDCLSVRLAKFLGEFD